MGPSPRCWLPAIAPARGLELEGQAACPLFRLSAEAGDCFSYLLEVVLLKGVRGRGSDSLEDQHGHVVAETGAVIGLGLGE